MLASFADSQSFLSPTTSAAVAVDGDEVAGEGEAALAVGAAADGDDSAVPSSPLQAVTASSAAQVNARKEVRTRFTSGDPSGSSGISLSYPASMRGTHWSPRI
ncbi:hypothetical protein Xph01_56400 [Micromonospora phaseoli]|nr:hypothetical protein Xph01_56400 [Micromonospora phaseoli]